MENLVFGGAFGWCRPIDEAHSVRLVGLSLSPDLRGTKAEPATAKVTMDRSVDAHHSAASPQGNPCSTPGFCQFSNHVKAVEGPQMKVLMDRRRFLFASLVPGAALIAGAPIAFSLPAGAARPQLLGYPDSGAGPSRNLNLAPTPSCGRHVPTEKTSTGPFYTPQTPRRSNLIDPGMAGVPITISGRVVDTHCRPLAGAVLDFWQADSKGRYDNEGFRLRGHQYTDNEGSFSLVTVKPRYYSSFFTFRTPHIHVMAQGVGTHPLSTQLFFSDEKEGNARDGLIRPSPIMPVKPDGAGGLLAKFEFVLETAPA